LGILYLLVLTACSDGDSPTEPGGGPNTSDITAGQNPAALGFRVVSVTPKDGGRSPVDSTLVAVVELTPIADGQLFANLHKRNKNGSISGVFAGTYPPITVRAGGRQRHVLEMKPRQKGESGAIRFLTSGGTKKVHEEPYRVTIY